jgi:hypothetical protein
MCRISARHINPSNRVIKRHRRLRSVKVRSVKKNLATLVQQGNPKRVQTELLRPICTAPRRGLKSEEPVSSRSAIGGKKMVFHTL